VLAGVRRGRKGYEINAWRQVSEVPRFFQYPSSDLDFGSATFFHTGRREELAQPAIVRQFKTMTRDAIKTLFHPFEAGDVDMPDRHARVLFLGAEPGFVLPAGFEGQLHLVQGFRPYYLALGAAGRFPVTPRAEGEGYDAVLVLVGRHRGLNERNIAEAVERTRLHGLVLIAGGKEDGIASLRKRLSDLLELDGHLSKYHSQALWFRRSVEAEAMAVALKVENPNGLVDGRFLTAPGMFSYNRVDAGSRLLLDNLPDDLSGSVADFCAGWGYLAAEILARAPEISKLDLYEADFESLEAAKANLAGIRPATGRQFFWHDLVGEPVTERYDAIVMNPPFHKGNAADPAIGQKMIKTAAGALRRGGRLFMVANRQLPYEVTLNEVFGEHREISRDSGFKVLSGVRRR
jgi:16S rRNA (guanine1207-N2)-methyltransferase